MGPLKAAGLLSDDSNSTRCPTFPTTVGEQIPLHLARVTVSQLPIEKLLFVCVVAHVMGADR